MYISISTAVPATKYEWFVYHGKPRTFKKHNRKFELSLVPKDKIGIRKYGSGYKLVDASEVTMLFTFTEREVKRLVKDCKGFNGKVAGIKVVGGTGGLDKKKAVPARTTRKPGASASGVEKVEKKKKPATRTVNRRREPVVEEPPKQTEKEERKHFAEVPASDPELYPALSMPPKLPEIQRLYNHFNKKYFKGECPDHIKFTWSGARSFSGQARISWTAGHITYGMKLSKQAFTENTRVIHVLLHEMIHLFHYKKAYEDGIDEYVKAGHGPLFLRDMHRINSHGYKLDVVENDLPDADMQNKMFCAQWHATTGELITFHSLKGPFLGNLNKITEHLRQVFKFEYTRIVYGTTKNADVSMSNRLTEKTNLVAKRAGLRVGQKGSKFWDAMEGVGKSITVIEDRDISRTHAGVADDVIRGTDRCAPYLEYNWGIFLSVVLSKSGRVPSAKVNTHDVKLLEMIAEERLTIQELTYVKRLWSDADDAVFLKGAEFTRVRKEVLKYSIDDEQAAAEIAKVYKARIENRMTPDHFAELATKALSDIIVELDDNEFKALVRKYCL